MFDWGSFLRTAVVPRPQGSHNHESNWSQTDQECIIFGQRMPMLVHYTMSMTASPLLKYIYLNGAGAAAKERFIATCRKNFLVYILSVDLDESKQDANENRECGDLRRISEEHIELQSQCSSIYVPPIWKENETPGRSTKARQRQPDRGKSKLYKFIKKILPKSKSLNKNFNEVVVANVNVAPQNFEGVSVGTMDSPQSLVLPHSPMNQSHLNESEHMNLLHEIRELSSQIEESESTIRNCLLRYVQDKNVSKDLLHAVSTHGCLLQDACHRSHDLNNEHWIQQVRVHKEEQRNMETTMTSLIQQNRNLIRENEMLSMKNEQLSAAAPSISNFVCSKSKSSPIIEDLTKNNETLRTKVNQMLGQITNLEECVKKGNKRCQMLQQQLNNSTSQLQSNKVNFEKHKAECDMHIAKLNAELQRTANLVQESTEQENIIMQDLEMLKIQLQPISKAINWERFHKSQRPLPDLIHLNRSFINELSSALIYKQKELNIAKSEIETLSLENCNLGPLREEIKALHVKLEQLAHVEKNQKEEIQTAKEQLATSEMQMTSFTSIISEKDNNIESKENLIKAREEEIHNLNEVVLAVQKEFNQLQFEADKLRHENNALRTQIKGMAHVLTATGAGDIAKELANSQEKLTAVQTQFFALAAENNILMKQIETNKSERQTLVAYQKNCYEQLQVLHKEIENMEKTNSSLKEQLENEKQTVNALQTERVRHLEERTILTAIYERLKSEISKVDQLEGAVTSMNKKASKLAMIAEYNKQLGEKLQIEVAEKDEAINELQNNVKQLNSFQMESTKEKVALCEELNKVFSVKEVLNTKLTAELEKNVILDESKKEIQNSANLQLKEIQAAYNREHAALKNLVRDVKQLVAERDSLLEVNKAKDEEYIAIVSKHDKLVDVIKNLQLACKDKDKNFYDLEAISEKQSNDIRDLKAAHENEINYIQAKFEIASSQVESLKSENGALRGSLEYLQNDVNKIRMDLDQAKQSESEFKKDMDELQNTYNDLYREYKSKSNALEQIIEENSALKINVYSLGEKYKCLSKENERMSQESERMENILAEKYQNTKIPGLPTPKYVENVLDDINARDEEILILQDKLRDNDSRCMELSELLQTVSENRNQLQHHIQQLEEELSTVIEQLDKQRQRADNNEQIIDEIKKKTVLLSEYKSQQEQFTNTIETLKEEYGKHLQAIETEMTNLQDQNEELKTELNGQIENVNQYKEAHEKLQKAHRVLALKLFSAVRVLICEKVALEASDTKMKKAQEESQDLRKIVSEKDVELDNLNKQVKLFRSELDMTKCENASLFEDVQKAREETQEMREKLEAKLEVDDNVENIIQKQQECISTLKNQLDTNRKSTDKLQMIIAEFEEKQAEIEFEKSETVLRIHELQMQAQTEIARNNEMKCVMQKTLAMIIEMKEHGRITPHVHNQLLQSFSEVHV